MVVVVVLVDIYTVKRGHDSLRFYVSTITATVVHHLVSGALLVPVVEKNFR